MDPINIITGFNILATFGANFSGARLGLKSSLIVAKEKPKTYLQTLPMILSAMTLLALILGVFQVGTLDYNGFENTRIYGLIVYILFSWIQIWAYKTLGDNYSQEIIIFSKHKLVTNGPFRFIRHPQYISQILLDIGGGIATLSYIVIIITLAEIPFIIMRASLEEKLLHKNFKESFSDYKKRSGFMIPFIG
jgi:protein-S-isoprenylcysteine O-methyltransferase Ste14